MMVATPGDVGKTAGKDTPAAGNDARIPDAVEDFPDPDEDDLDDLDGG